MFVRKAIFTLAYIKTILRTYVYRSVLYKRRNELSKEEGKILRELFKNGFCVINDYWSKEKCEKIKIELESKVKSGKNEDYISGAYVRSRKSDSKFDNGVIRMYHVDREVKELCSFRFDEGVFKIAKAYYGYPVYSSFITFQHNKPSLKGTRGYHVDGWVDEFKAFLYLEDVNEDKGPFAYLNGSNNAYFFLFISHSKNRGDI